jgi:hypothetical protein
MSHGASNRNSANHFDLIIEKTASGVLTPVIWGGKLVEHTTSAFSRNRDKSLVDDVAANPANHQNLTH